MASQHPHEEDASRRTLWLSMALIVASAVVSVTYYFWRNGVSDAPTNSVGLVSAAKAAPFRDPNKLVGKDKERFRSPYLAHARLLREEWRKFAEGHKDLLLRMRRTDPNDNDAIYRIQAEIDKAHTESLKRSIGLPYRLLDGATTPFTWQLMSGVMISKTPQQQQETDRFMANQKVGIQQNFQKHRDVVLSYSMSPGRWQLAVWASGRITQKESQDIFQGYGRLGKVVQTPHEEIEPPYEFLTP